MKVIVLHGDHVSRSYARLSQFLATAKSREWEIYENSLEVTPSLFSTGRLFIFRDYRELTKGNLKALKTLEGVLVIYKEGLIPALFLKTLPQETKVELFELPKLIWHFLDQPTLKTFQQVVKNEPVEFVFSLLARRFRDLYWVKTDPETFTPKGWQYSKLKTQSAKYSVNELKEIVRSMADIDIKVKTSKAELLSSLDLFFLTRLQ